MPAYSVFRVPVAGVYEFTLNATFTAPITNFVASLWKNNKVQFTTTYSKSGFTGGVMIAKTHMETTDTAFFSVQVAGSTGTTAGNLLTHHVSHWCSVRLIEY
jgi:hypothetical protein